MAVKDLKPEYQFSSGVQGGAFIRRRIRLAALHICFLMFFLPSSLSARSQILTDKWAQLSPAEFETYRSIFAAYGIETYRADIVVLKVMSVTAFRIESGDFCAESLCLTIITLSCGRMLCPSTSVFVKRAVEFDKQIAGPFGGTWFLVFPLSEGRNIVVMANKRFVSAWRGFGEN
ncbi:MAG: hypothetical protein WCE79_13540 [Xanthobacteraceae bacterium]